MRFLKSVFNFYLESSIHVSLAVCAFSWMSFLTLHIPVDISYLIFLFLGAITGYNFVKYAQLVGFHHRSLTRNLKGIQVFSFLIFLGFLYAATFMSREILFGSFILGLITLFYIVPFLKSRNLRSLSGIKIMVVAFVWAGVTVILPWLLYSNLFPGVLWMVFIQRFLWVLVLTLPFEIRDLVYDEPNLGTLPQRWGIRKTRRLGVILLLPILVIEFFRTGTDAPEVFLMAVMLLITAGFLLISEKNQSLYFSAFWVESIPILWWVLYRLF